MPAPSGPGTRAAACALLLAVSAAPAFASMRSEIAAAAKPLSGSAGVYVLDLRTGAETAWNADETFPTASLIKVPLLAVLLDKVSKGGLDYDSPLVYRSTRAYPGGDMLGSFADGSTVTVGRLAFLTASMSDNTAALWVQELDGGGAAVNAWLAARGFERTRVNSRTPGREADQRAYGWGQTTPRELGRVFAAVWKGTLLTPAADEELARVLGRSFWDGEALSAVPPTVRTLSKQGAVDAARGECLAVGSPAPGYVLCALTKDLKDHGWGHEQEGFAFLRRVSALVWRHFNPGRPYAPPEGAERFWKGM
ncbi:MAG: serine hydrolase [Elusimicrobia bacterium]|nr:serine hydrolase [Elusimicrobiota bacterium]